MVSARSSFASDLRVLLIAIGLITLFIGAVFPDEFGSIIATGLFFFMDLVQVILTVLIFLIVTLIEIIDKFFSLFGINFGIDFSEVRSNLFWSFERLSQSLKSIFPAEVFDLSNFVTFWVDLFQPIVDAIAPILKIFDPITNFIGAVWGEMVDDVLVIIDDIGAWWDNFIPDDPLCEWISLC